MQKLNLFIVFHISIWEAWSFVWGAKPTKVPRGHGTAAMYSLCLQVFVVM